MKKPLVLIDLANDPREQHNLIDLPEYQELVQEMRTRMWDRLEETGGMQIPLRRGDWQACERLVP